MAVGFEEIIRPADCTRVNIRRNAGNGVYPEQDINLLTSPVEYGGLKPPLAESVSKKVKVAIRTFHIPVNNTS